MAAVRGAEGPYCGQLFAKKDGLSTTTANRLAPSCGARHSGRGDGHTAADGGQAASGA
jgi:hypothetical protein